MPITVDTVLAVGRLTDERDALRAENARLRAGLEECFGTSCDWCDHLSAAGCCRKQYKHPCRSKVVRAHTMRIFFRLGDRAPQNAALEVSTDGTEPSE